MYNCGVRLAVVLCVAACGGGAAPATVDGKAIDSHPIDRCSPTGAFGTPTELMTLNGPTAELGGRLSDDELDILFSRTNTDGTWDIWSSSRTDPTAPFAAPAVVGAINTIYSELWPTMSPDQKTLFIMTDRVNPGTFGIEISTRASTTANWGPPAADADLMTGDSNPYVPNAASIYFSSATRPGVASYDIFRGALDTTGKITAIASVIGGVNSAVQEVVPVVTADELHIYFARYNGTDYDVYEASRTSITDGFGAATAVPGISTTGYDELPSWVSPDGCHLYYSSAAGVSGEDLFMVARGN